MQPMYSHFLSLILPGTTRNSRRSMRARLVRTGRHRGAGHVARRPGLTLIEMLVAVTITLLVILAIVQVFQLLGTNIKNGQAMIDVTTELRFIGQQLQQDLDGLTCPARTWIDPAAGLGYLEIYDGPSRDADWDNDGSLDMAPGSLADTSLGDVDDFIALTTRNTKIPFVGRVPAANAANEEYIDQAESKDAEVVWWTAIVAPTLIDRNRDGIMQAQEIVSNGRLGPTTSVMLFRRALLILPSIDLSPWEGTTLARPAGTLDDVLDFLDNYDVSVRWIDGNGDGVRDLLLPNTLSDLTQRQNRFMHLGLTPPPTNVPDWRTSGLFPFPAAQAAVGSPRNQNGPAANGRPINGELADGNIGVALSENRTRFARFPVGIPLKALSISVPEDYLYYSQLMASSSLSDNILAFDIRCYDPGAPLFIHRDQANVVIAPGDPAYPYDATGISAQMSAGLLSGVGAYVDLNYAHGTPVSTRVDVDGDGSPDKLVTSNFASLAPSTNPSDLAGWWPFYDVWSTQYERDGVDQNRNGLIDEGTNEIDDDEENGVDDVSERETAPPYDVPLRGIKVTIRKMDYETRQTRQISVVGDFVPE